MNTAITYHNVKTKTYLESLKTCLQPYVCDPFDLYRDQALLFIISTIKSPSNVSVNSKPDHPPGRIRTF